MDRQMYMNSDDTVVDTAAEAEKKRSVVILDTVVPRDEIERRNSRRLARQPKSWTAKFQEFLRKCRIEQRGIEPVPEEERSDTNGVITIGTMVRSAPCDMSSFLLFVLAVARLEHGRKFVRDRRHCDTCL
jgi:hypothetical protein